MSYPKFSYEEFQESYKQNKFILIDVRSQKDYELEHIPEAISFPIEELTADKLEKFKDKTILFHCGGGSRARKACEKVSDDNSALNLAILEGGFRGWKARQL